jgi:tetratricopeptide (TPR) repeat protein
VVRSIASQGRVHDLFALQDRICQEILTGLALDPSPTEKLSMQRAEPANSRAYELYLRANRLGQNRLTWIAARDLYLECVREDPTYAPAWARLGRMHRVLAKFGQAEDASSSIGLAQEAFDRALSLDPDSSLAHNLYTYFEIEEKASPADAMVRLLQRAHQHPTDAELFSGLVVACRFCGILDASLAADRRGRQIDPDLSSSVAYTLWMLGDYEEAIRHDVEEPRYVRHYALPMIGRTEEAIAGYREMERTAASDLMRQIARSYRATLEGNSTVALDSARLLTESRFRDPEGRYFLARSLALIGERSRA